MCLDRTVDLVLLLEKFMGPSTGPQLDPIDLSKSKFKTSTFGDPLRNWKKRRSLNKINEVSAEIVIFAEGRSIISPF